MRIFRRLLLTLGLLLGASTVHAQAIAWVDHPVLNQAGHPVGGAKITVCAVGASGLPCAPTVTVYSDLGLTQVSPNPITADARGNYHFYATQGNYLLTFAGPSIQPYSEIITLFSGGSGGGSVSPAGIQGDIQTNGGASSLGAGHINDTGSNLKISENILPASSANISLKPANATAIQYVSPQGSDSNDGLSWGTAKLTIFAAAEALPGGSASPATTGNGTVVIADGSAANTISTCGIWLMGPSDPNYAAPPACWLRYSGGGLNFIGSPKSNTGPNAHSGGRAVLSAGSGADTTHPGIWLSATNSPVQFENLSIQYPGRGVVIAEYSNGQHPGAGASAVTSARFVNVGANINAVVGMGPTWDIWGGSFWLYFDNVGGGGNAAMPPTSAQAQSFYFHTAADLNTSQLVFMQDVNTDGGAIAIETGGNTGTVFSINGVSQEDGYSPAAVWITGTHTLGQFNLQNILVADAVGTLCNGTVCGVENDDVNLGAEQVVAYNVTGVKGPMLLTGSDSPNAATSGGTNTSCNGTPYANAQEGFINGCVYADTDAGRRLFGPSGIRFTNLANTAPASWNAPAGVTVTTGKTAPDGTSNAARAVNSTGSLNGPYFYSAPGGTTISTSVGDWYVFGVWSRYNAGPGWISQTQAQLLFQVCPITWSGSAALKNASVDGSWVWEVGAIKITSVTSGSTCAVSLFGTLNPSSADTADYYAPLLIHIAANTMPDTEVKNFEHSLASYDGACPVGTSCGIAGEVPYWVNGFQDIPETAAPANPASGKERVYADSTAHTLTCLTSSGGNCMSGGGGGSPAGNNGDLQMKSSAVFAAAHINDNGSTVNATEPVTLKMLENAEFVDGANSQGWSGADYGAWVTSAIAALPTVNGYKTGEVFLAPSTAVITQSSQVAITSPFVSIIGPGSGALQISCTFNGSCWDVHTNSFVIDPGFQLSGFSVVGQGTSNANAVGLHAGDVVGGKFSDLVFDNFRGGSSACIWLDNINGFTERNTFQNVTTGLAQTTQLGCTKGWRFTNTGNIAGTSSFDHNHFLADRFSVLAGQTGISVEGGSIVDDELSFTGNVATGSNGIVLAMSGSAYSGGGNTIFDASLHLTVECTSPCSGGTLLSLPSTYVLNNRSGYVFDSSGLLTQITGAGRYTKQLSDPQSAGQIRTNTTNSDGSLTIFDTTPAASNPQKFIRISAGTLQVLNSAFATPIMLLSDAGVLTTNVFQSNTSNPAASGLQRLAKTDQICWRNNANGADVCLAINGSDQVTFNGSILGGAGLTSFSSGNLSPLFTTAVATPTTTPALSFTLSTAAANKLFANCTGSTAAPSFCSLVAAMEPATTVNSFVNDTNVTAAISAQVATLGWSGTLSGPRGGWGQALPTPTRAGDLFYYNGTTWLSLAGNNSGTNFLSENPSGVPSWATPSGLSGLTTDGVVYATSSTNGASVTPPATKGQYVCGYTVPASSAVAPTCPQAGLAARAITGATTTDTVLFSDNGTVITHDSAASGTVGETLPTATTLGNSLFVYSYCNKSAQTDVITPTTWTVNGASTLSVSPTTCYRIYVDPNSATNWLADGEFVGANGACVPNTFSALTDGTTVTWAIANSVCVNKTLTFTTHGGSRTLNITNPVNGGSYVLKLIQDGTGGEGLTLGTGCTWKVSNGGVGAVTLTNSAAAIDVLAFTYDGTNCLANLGPHYN